MKRTELLVYQEVQHNLDECVDLLLDFLDKNRNIETHEREGLLRDIQILLVIQRGFNGGGE